MLYNNARGREAGGSSCSGICLHRAFARVGNAFGDPSNESGNNHGLGSSPSPLAKKKKERKKIVDRPSTSAMTDMLLTTNKKLLLFASGTEKEKSRVMMNVLEIGKPTTRLYSIPFFVLLRRRDGVTNFFRFQGGEIKVTKRFEGEL